jgi:hypothetical protein
MKSWAKIALALVLAVAAVGCGSSTAKTDEGGGGSGGGSAGRGGAGGASACQPIIPGDGTATWDDDGVAECATLTEAGRMTSSSQDFIEVIGSTTTGVGIAFTVVSYTGLLGGTYHCKNDAGISALYINFLYRGTLEDCTITFDNPGQPGGVHASGSFSGTFSGDGGTIDVTNGMFDTPVMNVGG